MLASCSKDGERGCKDTAKAHQDFGGQVAVVHIVSYFSSHRMICFSAGPGGMSSKGVAGSP